ncbi:DUF2231 domain-containing protein [Umezakia ovalisporum]|jgi:uncharacterized membrane protein|uniref:DUF2231 domain-containing protein n=2 Tax=Umezakia ovalisporum TaxID=75695 RepID=A0AA43KEH4_9CYAN|nr:DUF2231 domain-containing protein [Umezakia ovalisporum]MBI1242665.1 DUF2231 domain-containing protein [Nostoc sp. RI_552]MDH6057579.1 DUF2231 domain-containing protein [Umezakia ovalisporum FSS-43]MDH6063462.1 DUF2231 domain-containing protein [Umezakia ovalisporum FSS-62]MDH6066490.1 DUF2231 domain-containing protein [Umezakia ovalisporum APH033B]MDH6072387.1 DUF2231 domain-containing protein [Umezakia ovalisporum CobakiLakeA]
METTGTESNSTPFPNIPPIIESDDREYRDSGVASTVAIAGHPLHPLTMIFPIAFLAGALGSDFGYWLTEDFFWARASLWLIGLGLLGGIIAAITGMSDFLRIERVRKRTAGWTHLILNVTILIFTAFNLILRLGNPEARILPWGFFLSLVVGTLTSITGWFGAELSYRHKIGVVGAGSRRYP